MPGRAGRATRTQCRARASACPFPAARPIRVFRGGPRLSPP